MLPRDEYENGRVNDLIILHTGPVVVYLLLPLAITNRLASRRA